MENCNIITVVKKFHITGDIGMYIVGGYTWKLKTSKGIANAAQHVYHPVFEGGEHHGANIALPTPRDYP